MKLTEIKYLFLLTTLLIIIILLQDGYSQLRIRNDIDIPDILGYETLKCDFHMHTVFSDGEVWPTVRVEEAWCDGLDAIAITDHIEYQAHKEDIAVKHNRSYDLAKPHAKGLDLSLIRGAEITREMPPGHFNALFLNDAALLDTPEWQDAIKAAHTQGAFIFWNHPGWSGQQPDGKARWYNEHTELVNSGILHGMEVVNFDEYYPEAHQWCLDKNLTMLGNSDVHDPIYMNYDSHKGTSRPVTLVFAQGKTTEAIKDALFSRRTAVYFNNTLIGKKEYLESIFYNSIQILNSTVILEGKNHKYVQILNNSEVDFELIIAGDNLELDVPSTFTLYGGKTVIMAIRSKEEIYKGEKSVQLPFRVKNMKITPEEGLPVVLELNVIKNN
jgi:predicted metal-dependent phosphoesterase TrpH